MYRAGIAESTSSESHFRQNVSQPKRKDAKTFPHAILLPIRSNFQPQRRAQNRASQRAFRQRQTAYIRALEQELEEGRTKYDKLRRSISQLKLVVDEICMEGVEQESF
jgi:hypothetical protein